MNIPVETREIDCRARALAAPPLAAALSAEDKKAILLRWEVDADALMRATEEGMPPEDGRRSPAELLRAVQAALEALDGR